MKIAAIGYGSRRLPPPANPAGKTTPMLEPHKHACNLMTGRQLRAARQLAGLTQKSLGAALGIDERAVRFWERRHFTKPTGSPNDRRIELTLLEHGVILISEPAPGVILRSNIS